MADFKVVSEKNNVFFENEVQKLLDDGYKLQNTFCGLYNYVDGSYDSCYKAILIKD